MQLAAPLVRSLQEKKPNKKGAGEWPLSAPTLGRGIRPSPSTARSSTARPTAQPHSIVIYTHACAARPGAASPHSHHENT